MRSASGRGHTEWDPDQYQRFERERAQPFHDLVARIPEHPVRYAADLGCGTGELTRGLLRRWPSAHIWAVDNSAEMLSRARQQDAPSGLEFVEADLRTWRPPRALDLLLSNAAMQWVGDHEGLLEGFARLLASRGILAVQMPNNREEAAYRILAELCSSDPWSRRLPAVPFTPALEAPGWYAQRLAAAGFEFHLWETTYFHLLPGPEAILAWLRGTALRPVLSTLGTAESVDFLRLLSQRLEQAYPRTTVGVLFPFKRLFFVARLP
jgi:trans-aconitate 2-methyltransferase